MPASIDLHSHSTASDGTLTPAALVAAAAERGVQVLALTDHDSTAGLAEAVRTAAVTGIELVSGVEISVTWGGRTVHIVGLNVDPGHARLQQGLAKLREFRDWRAVEIGRRLAKRGIDGALEGARAYAQGGLLSRTHFARYLVERGCGRTLQEVFKHYLVNGKPGHVRGEWTSLDEAVDWISDAGGQAVVAHPARYRLSATKLRLLLWEFKAAGGAGLEVVSGSHGPGDTQSMAAHARRLELYASQGSDYHGPENPWVDLGRLRPLPEGCVPIWESSEWRVSSCK